MHNYSTRISGNKAMKHDAFPPGRRRLPLIGPEKTASGGQRFCVWAPLAKSVELELVEPRPGFLAMQALDEGYWQVETSEIRPGGLYRFRLDGNLSRPDPASHHQPGGVHAPSALVDHEAHIWRCQDFSPPKPSELILYELHIGTFTPQGTFQAAEQRLGDLADLGVKAVQVMPLGQFPGSRNWGYDGTYPFSVQHSYGGPQGFKSFVDACHAHGLGVVLDVVYNHLGPEGNYLRDFGPYFTDQYRTPWGEAVNFDGPESDHVRHYFLQNIGHWLDRYHVDGFRLDATHAIHDKRPLPFLQELADLARATPTAGGGAPLVLAENDLNDPRLVTPTRAGGLGLSGLFNEDFHHGVHAWFTGERQAYYQDYGRLAHLARTLGRGFAYTGQYSAFRRRSHGRDFGRLPPETLVAFLQNHDQVGNRAHGERLADLVHFQALKAGAALLLLSPFTPMLFMGEEYGEENPFLYFVSHGDPGLVEAVRAGRSAEFAGFHQGQPPPPDPQSLETFQRSKLDWAKRSQGRCGQLLAWHQELIRARKRFGFDLAGRKLPKVLLAGESGLLILAGPQPTRTLCLFNLSGEDKVSVEVLGWAAGGKPARPGPWLKVLDSAEKRWAGPGSTLPRQLEDGMTISRWSAAVYVPEEAGA